MHRCCESSFRLSIMPQTACCHTNARSLDRFCWDWLLIWATRRKCRSRDRTSHNQISLVPAFALAPPDALSSPATPLIPGLVHDCPAAAPFCPPHSLALNPDLLRFLPPLGSVFTAHRHIPHTGLSIHPLTQTPSLLAPHLFWNLLFSDL